MKYLHKSLPIWLWLLLTVVFATELWRYRGDVRFDDAFMFIRYADNLLEGGNYGWNIGEKTFGCTSIPYTFFIYFLKLAGIGTLLKPSLILLLASVCWGVAAFILLERVFARCFRDTPFNNGIISKILVLFLIVNPYVMKNLVTGMDTSMSLFFNTLMVWAFFKYIDRPTRKMAVIAAFCSYFSFLVRPDNGIYALLFPLAFLLYHRVPLRNMAFIFLDIFIFISIDTVVKYVYFGNPLPLPYYAKTKGFYNAYTNIYLWNNLEYMFQVIASASGILIVVNLLVTTKDSIRTLLLLLAPVAVTFAYLSTILQIMGTEARYYIPSIPFLLLALLLAVVQANQKLQLVTPRRLTYALAAGTLFMVGYHVITPIYHEKAYKSELRAALKYPLPSELAGGAFYPAAYKMPMTEVFKSASALCKILPKGSTIAATEYGYIAAENPGLRIIDLCGLHNRDLALKGWSSDILKKNSPELIWMPPQGYVGLWYTITNDAYFRDSFELHTHTLRYGVAIRKNSPFADELREEIKKMDVGRSFR